MVAWNLARESGCPAVLSPTSQNSLVRLKDSSQTSGFHFKGAAGHLGSYSFIKKNLSGLWGEGYSRGCAGWAGGFLRNPFERHRWLGETAELRILVGLCRHGRCIVPCYFNLHIFIINIVFCMSQQLALLGR